MMSVRAASLVRDWARLAPLRRVAAWRRLTRAEAAAVFASLPPDARWLLYLGSTDGALAPLTERGRLAGLRRVTPAERAAMQRALA